MSDTSKQQAIIDLLNTRYENKMKAALFEEDCDFIPIELAEGRIARDFVTVYPPGIPVLVPGQMITGDDVDVLLKAKEQTLKITGLNNGEVAVIWEKSST